jgi:xylulokinase
MSLLGIDAGTSGCKAAVFSVDGRMLALAYEEYDYEHRQPGWAEWDAAAVWRKIQHTICRAAAAAAPAGDPVQALCVSSLGEAVVPVSAQREILGPSLLNFDVRGNEYLERLSGADLARWWFGINGNTPASNYTLTKLMWIKEHQPALYERTHAFLHWSGFISFMLGAEPRVDYSLANRTLLFDLERQDWSAELLALAGLDREKLPPTIPSGVVIGSLGRGMAQELGLPAGIPIVSGGHDQCCNAAGCGVLHPGSAMYGMGTFLCLTPVYDRRPPAEAMIARGLNTEHHVAPGRYVSFIYNQGGALVKWFRDTFAAAERRAAAEAGVDPYPQLMAEMPPGPSRVMVLPHFTVTGPPRYIADSSGVLAGLKLETTRGEILKGIIEASTFYLREVFETLPGVGIEIGAFIAVGGGSKSDAWVQTCADILGRPFMRPRVSEAGALGAAILAGVGSGVFPSLEAGAQAMVAPGAVFEPDPARQRLYDVRYEKYTRLAPLMEDYLRDLG